MGHCGRYQTEELVTLPTFWAMTLCDIRLGFKEAALFGRTLLCVLIVAGYGLGPAVAQEDLNRGKTPVQLFASDCADCHRNPRALTRRGNAGALADFLRVHYTASRESAAAIAGYLVSLGPPPRAGSARPAAPARPGPAAAQSQTKPTPATPPAEKPNEAASPNPPEPEPQVAPAAAPASEPAPATAPAGDPQ